MDEQEALDALADAIGKEYPPYAFGSALVAVGFLRDNPDVMRALGLCRALYCTSCGATNYLAIRAEGEQ